LAEVLMDPSSQNTHHITSLPVYMYSPQTTLVRGLSLKEEMITHPVKMKCHSLYTVFQKKNLDPFLLNE